MHVVVSRLGNTLRADYNGGPYVEITFATDGYRPTERLYFTDYIGKLPHYAEDWDQFDEDDEYDMKVVKRSVDLFVGTWMMTQHLADPAWYQKAAARSSNTGA